MRTTGVVLLLTLAVGSCSGEAPRATHPAPPRSPAPAGTSRVKAATAPQAMMTSGTDVARGVLVSWCERGACERDPGARPARYLPGDGNGVVFFAVSAAPTGARAEVRSSTGAVVARDSLVPGTTMAFGGRLGRGRFLVTLVATWQRQEARWLFGLQGPLGA